MQWKLLLGVDGSKATLFQEAPTVIPVKNEN